MRRILLLTSILLISSAWAMAQYESGAEAASRASAFGTTVVGCLDGAAGNYTLTLPSGSAFQLSGNETWLKGHVGETVRVWGVEFPVVRIPGSMSEGTATQPTIELRSVQPISGVCTPTSNTIP